MEVLGARVLLPHELEECFAHHRCHCMQTNSTASKVELVLFFPHTAKFLAEAYEDPGLIFKQTITCAVLLLKAASQKEQMLSQHLSC